MVYKPILIVAGEPNSIFSEIFFKSIKYKKYKSPIIIIASKKLIELQNRKLNVNKKIRQIDFLDIEKYNFDNRKINLIDVNFDQKKPFKRISNKSNTYIEKSFEIAIQILKKKITNKFINGPISKKFFLKKKFLGITDCESTDDFNEDDKIIKPTTKSLIKSNYRILGPFAADTIFLRKNRKKFNVIIGMYHDQVLTPIKTLFEYDAINITLGLPFIRISPDHGPNESMLGKNKSNPKSLINALTFLDLR